MIYFDELSATKEMEESQSFKNGYTKTDLFMYTKYLKYKKAIESGIDYENITEDQLRSYNQSIECELRAFCERACLDFNYTTKYQDIDFALEYSCKYKLKLPRPLPITQREWNSIMSVSNENYRKMLFVMLVDAKYYKYFSTSVENDKQIDDDTVFYVRMTRSEIQKAAKVKYANQSEKDFFLGCINRKGLFDISDSKLCSWYIKFVDISNENIIESITDYDHLDLYYEKLSGGKIGKCEYCGNLFRQGKTKPSIYCYKHRGYSKQKIQSLICVDCGSEFTISSKSRNACRCENCQNERNKAKKAERNRRYYQTHRD